MDNSAQIQSPEKGQQATQLPVAPSRLPQSDKNHDLKVRSSASTTFAPNRQSHDVSQLQPIKQQSTAKGSDAVKLTDPPDSARSNKSNRMLDAKKLEKQLPQQTAQSPMTPHQQRGSITTKTSQSEKQKSRKSGGFFSCFCCASSKDAPTIENKNLPKNMNKPRPLKKESESDSSQKNRVQKVNDDIDGQDQRGNSTIQDVNPAKIVDASGVSVKSDRVGHKDEKMNSGDESKKSSLVLKSLPSAPHKQPDLNVNEQINVQLPDRPYQSVTHKKSVGSSIDQSEVIDSIGDDAVGNECQSSKDKRINYSSITRAGAQRNDFFQRPRKPGQQDNKMPSDFLGQKNRDLLPGGMITPQNKVSAFENFSRVNDNVENTGDKTKTAEFFKETPHDERKLLIDGQISGQKDQRHNYMSTPRSISRESQQLRLIQSIKDGGQVMCSSAKTPKVFGLKDHNLVTQSDGKDFDRLTEILDMNTVKPGDHTFGKQNSKASFAYNIDGAAKGEKETFLMDKNGKPINQVQLQLPNSQEVVLNNSNTHGNTTTARDTSAVANQSSAMQSSNYSRPNNKTDLFKQVESVGMSVLKEGDMPLSVDKKKHQNDPKFLNSEPKTASNGQQTLLMQQNRSSKNHIEGVNSMRKTEGMPSNRNFNREMMKKSQDLMLSQEHQYNNLRQQQKGREVRYKEAQKMFNKIQKDLKNVERDNLELQEMLTTLLQNKLAQSEKFAQL